MTIGKRIKGIREKNGLSQGQFGKIIGATGSAVGLWERDERTPNRRHLDSISDSFGVSLIRLQFGESEQSGYDHQAPVIGKIGAGGHILPIDDHIKGGGLDLVDAPPNAPAGTVAAIIDGDSFFPILKNGSLIFWSSRRSDLDNFLNELIVCHLIDGRKMIKILTRGSEAGTYTLMSSNAAAMENLQVESVSPIDWMKPR